MTFQQWQKKMDTCTPIALLTAYDATMARLIEHSHIDGILVGDSLRHTFYGDTTTVTMSLNDMVYHTRAVCNGTKKTLVIADMPFMTYGISIENTLQNATQLIQAGASAVKCESRSIHIPTIQRLIQEGIPVMGHIGLQPQYIHESGGYRLTGQSVREQKSLIELATQLSDIGACGIVLEKVPISVSKTITNAVNCPTIGIGAGPHCSGQILVTNDILGLTPNFSPKFIKNYLDGADMISKALSQFKTDVETQQFPTNDHGYEIK
ncbi:MAG: 3-methyl-2-oxobutanoate hydroxymethyltransferase [Candidatus Marinamargulisbacteria bacterium]